MSTGIHAIVQIRKNNAWQEIPYCPEQLKIKDYNMFAFLAGIRNDFAIKGFEPRGLPDDLPTKQCHWKDISNEAIKRYIKDKATRVVMPNGTLKKRYDDLFAVNCKHSYEAEKYDDHRTIYGNKNQYIGYDYGAKGGKITEVCLSRIYPDFNEYLNHYYDEYMEDRPGEIGYYEVDFDCPDYHSHSWLLLSELINADKSSYTAYQAKVPAEFYNEFKRRKGELPEGMSAITERKPNGLRDALSEAFAPTVIIEWQPDEKTIADMPLTKLINELIDVSTQYKVLPEEVRIVFAFDN